MFCTKCGKELQSNDDFCGGCGAKVQVEPELCASCRSVLLSDNAFCAGCGQSANHGFEIPPESRPAQVAAQRLDNQQNREISQYTKTSYMKPKKSKKPLYFALVAAAIVITVLVIFEFTNGYTDEPVFVMAPESPPTPAVVNTMTPTPTPTPEPTPEPTVEPTFINRPQSANIRDSIGIWEGEFTEYYGDEATTRQIRFNIAYTDGSIISGIAELDANDENPQRYYFTGTIDKSTLQVSIQGDRGLDYPYSSEFGTFDGVLDLFNNRFEGIVDSNELRPFSLYKTDSVISDAYRHRISSRLSPFDGEFDNSGWVPMMNMPNRNVVQRNIVEFPNFVDGRVLSRDEIVFTDGFSVGYRDSATTSRANFNRWLGDYPGSLTYTVDTTNFDMFRVMFGIGRSERNLINAENSRPLYGEIRIYIDGLLALEENFATRYDEMPILFYLHDAETLRIEASGLGFCFFEPYFRRTDGETETSTTNYPEMFERTIVFPVGREERAVQVMWGAELFSQTSDVFNNDLALLSAALAGATSNIDGNLRGNGHHIYEAFLELGFTSENIRLYSYPGHHRNQDGKDGRPYVQGAADGGLAYAIATRFITVNGEDTSLIVIAMRGTQGFHDILNFATIPVVMRFMNDYSVFLPFIDFYRDVLNGFNDFITHYNFSSNVHILITGHSLGGATAQLVSATMQNQVWSINSQIHTYTIGSPNPMFTRTGTGVAGNFNNIFNIVNPGSDLVIDAPDPFGSKFGLILAIPSRRSWGRSDERARFETEYLRLMGIDDELSAAALIARNDAITNIGSHSAKSYIAWIRANPTYGRKVGGITYSPDSPF